MNSKKLRAKTKSDMSSYKRTKDLYLSTFDNFIHYCATTSTDHQVGIVLTESHFIFGEISADRIFELQNITSIPRANITKCYYLAGSEIVNYRQKEISHIVVAKKKNVIARGVIGGLIAGPAGLILGAASGLSRDEEIKEVINYKNASRVAELNPILTIEADEKEYQFELFKNDAEKICREIV